MKEIPRVVAGADTLRPRRNGVVGSHVSATRGVAYLSLASQRACKGARLLKPKHREQDDQVLLARILAQFSHLLVLRKLLIARTRNEVAQTSPVPTSDSEI